MTHETKPPSSCRKPAQTDPNKQNQPYQMRQTFVKEENHAPSERGDRITLCVKDENGVEFACTVRRNTPFKKIFAAFANKVNVTAHHFRFHYDGLRVGEDDSPERIGLGDTDTDNCIIEAYLEVHGG